MEVYTLLPESVILKSRICKSRSLPYGRTANSPSFGAPKKNGAQQDRAVDLLDPGDDEA